MFNSHVSPDLIYNLSAKVAKETLFIVFSILADFGKEFKQEQ